MMPEAHPDTNSVADAPAPAADAVTVGSDEQVIRSWSDRRDQSWIEALQAAFLESRATAKFQNTFYGPEAVLAGVYTGVADLAWMAREIRDRQEIMAYQWSMLEAPFPVAFAHGGMEAQAPGTQLCVIVHPSNPVGVISLDEVDAIYGWECRRGLDRLTKWSQLEPVTSSVSGAIRPVSAPVDCVEMLHVRQLCLRNSFKWNPNIRQVFSGWEDVVNEVGKDPGSIAIVPMNFTHAGVKSVALADRKGGNAFIPCRWTIRSEEYPLTRTREIYLKGSILASSQLLQDFLGFVLGDTGQRIIEDVGGLIRLSAESRKASYGRISA